MRILALADIHGHESRLKGILDATPSRDGIIFAGDLLPRAGSGKAAGLVSMLGSGGGFVLGVPGNMDDPGLVRVFTDKAVSLHGSGHMIGETGFFGVGGANPTPFHSPFEISEEEIGRLLQRGYQDISRAALKIMVSHVPPIHSSLDRAVLGHGGSRAVRRFLKERDVHLCLCGHIHEAAGEEIIEGVRTINVGPAQSGHYAWLEIDKETIAVARRKI